MNETELKVALNELKLDLGKFSYVYARSDGLSIEDSAKKANRSKSWFYAFPKSEQERLEMLACELNAATKVKAKQILEDALLEAARVKVAGLKSRHDNIKQSAATEILDRNGLKPTDKLDVTSGGEKIGVEIVPINYRVAIANLTTGSEQDSDAPGEGEGTGNGAQVG